MVKSALTHWGRVTHISIGNLTIVGSDNGLSPGRRQAIIWTNAAILLIGPLGTNFSGMLSEIHTFSFKKMQLKMSSAKRRPFCLGLNVLTHTLWLGDAIWRESVVALVIIWCLMAPSHYVKQWLLTGEVLWHSPEDNFKGNAGDTYLRLYEFCYRSYI